MAMLSANSAVMRCYQEGIPGMVSNLNPHVYTTRNRVAGSTIAVASFVWVDANDMWTNVQTGGATVQPRGLVEYVLDGYIYDINQSTKFTFDAGERASVIKRGDVWAQSASAVTVGQKVFANITTGAVSTGAAGATVAGSIETAWVVDYVSPNSNNLFIMTNWNAYFALAASEG